MIWLSLLRQFWFVIPILALTASTAYYRHSAGQEHDKRIKIESEYQTFTDKVEAAGRLAEAKKLESEARYAKSINSALGSRDAALRRLREQAEANSGRGIVPLTPAPAQGSDRICFSPPEFAAAVAEFRGRIQEIARTGEAAQIDAKTLLESWPK